MSMSRGTANMKMRMMWGIMSIGGTGIGNRANAGNTAVNNGIACSRLDV